VKRSDAGRDVGTNQVIAFRQATSRSASQPRSLAHTDSKAVMPIKPAAQKFRLFIFCSTLDNSLAVSGSSVICFMLGKRHIADANQNAAEPHAAITTPVSISDFILTTGESM
jgi:hypothetical protein